MDEIWIGEGGRVWDDRGSVAFNEQFKFDSVKRFYTVTNHRRGFVRAWHGHATESKWVTVVRGAAMIGMVEIDNWHQPSKDLVPFTFVLTEYRPQMLHIPPGCANGFKTLTEDAVLLFFSSMTAVESRMDDYRYDARYWDVWQENER